MAEEKQKKEIEKEKQETVKTPNKTEKPKEEPKQQKEKKILSLPKNSKKQEKEEKVELERVYVVPLRKGFLKVPKYKRAKKAVKTLKEFLAKHMKVENRDLNNVKVDIYLNNEIWFRGIKKPLHKIKVRAKKINGVVYATLEDIPEYVKWNKQKHDKKKTKVNKKALEKVVTQEASEEKIKQERSDQESVEEEKEKTQLIKEKDSEKQSEFKTKKHTTQTKPSKTNNLSKTTQRKALKK